MLSIDIFRAMKAGEELVNAVKVKNAQGIANAVALLVVLVVGIARANGYVIPLTDDQLVGIASSCALFLFNVWATYASSRRVGVGLRPPSGGDDAGTPDTAGDRPVPGGWAKDMGIGRQT